MYGSVFLLLISGKGAAAGVIVTAQGSSISVVSGAPTVQAGATWAAIGSPISVAAGAASAAGGAAFTAGGIPIAVVSGTVSFSGSVTISPAGIAVGVVAGTASGAGSARISVSGSPIALQSGVIALSGILTGPIHIREAVGFRLAGSNELTAEIGNQLYFGALPQTAKLPAVTFFVTTREYGHVLAGSDGTSTARIQISSYGLTEAESDKVAQIVRDTFDGFKGTIGSVDVMSSLLELEVDIPHEPRAGTDQWIYEIAVDYSILHRISLPSSLSS